MLGKLPETWRLGSVQGLSPMEREAPLLQPRTSLALVGTFKARADLCYTEHHSRSGQRIFVRPRRTRGARLRSVAVLDIDEGDPSDKGL